jgi:hypothetical protein
MAKLRAQVVAGTRRRRSARAGNDDHTAPSARLPWAERLKRVFAHDVLACPCGGRRRVLTLVPPPKRTQTPD